MTKIQDDILSYREMCETEGVQTLQRGMNFRMNSAYSVILMSQRSGAPYRDRAYEDGVTIGYEGHDVPKNYVDGDVKEVDQQERLPSGRLTQNGLFIRAAERYMQGRGQPELVKVYEKIMSGVWSLKGLFDLVDYKVVCDGKRNTFRFILRLSDREGLSYVVKTNIPHTRLIPSDVKKEVWARDKGRCVECGSAENLHFDHDLPFSKGGTSLTAANIRLLCMRHNLQKSNKIE